ncbi:MAG: hypothetical protein HJJLKODD_02733 [Phycisphaerae bacterium]|nr:hypothetical protein [Phycisphaerae bacterium]
MFARRSGARLSLVLAIAAFSGQAAWAAETPEELLNRMEAKFKDFKTISLTSRMSLQSPFAQIEAVTQSKMWRDGETVRTRSERDINRTDPNGQARQISSLVVNDGQFQWTEDKEGEQVNVTKRPAPPQQPLDYSQLREKLKTGQVTLKDPEEIKGEPCAVLELVVTAPQPETVKYWFSEKNGMMVKFVSQGAMSSTTTLEVEGIKFDEALDAALFTYTPPAGVDVKDLTAPTSAPASQPTTQPAAEAPSAAPTPSATPAPTTAPAAGS